MEEWFDSLAEIERRALGRDWDTEYDAIVLAEAGLERMEAEGERFDPEVHDGLLTSPTDDPDEDQRVSRVLIQGYAFGDRVLRPARVEVKKYDAEAGEADDGDSGDEGGEA